MKISLKIKQIYTSGLNFTASLFRDICVSLLVTKKKQVHFEKKQVHFFRKVLVFFSEAVAMLFGIETTAHICSSFLFTNS